MHGLGKPMRVDARKINVWGVQIVGLFVVRVSSYCGVFKGNQKESHHCGGSPED